MTTSGKTKWLVRLVASAAVSAFMVAVLLRQLPGAQGEQTASVLNVLGHIVWSWIAIYLVLQVSQTVFRAIRYGVLLRAAGEPEVPGFFHLLLVTMTRNMFVDMVPARAGELLYIGLLNRGYRVSGQSCLSSLAISFIFDFIALGMVFVLLLGWHLLHAAWQPLYAVAGVAFLSAPAVALVALFRMPRPLLEWAEARLAGRMRPAWSTKLIAFAHRVVDAMETTQRSGTMGRTLLLSMAVRSCKYVGLFAAFKAVTVLNFPAMADASLLQVLTALLSSEAAASLPLPSFMSFGTYEAGGAAAWTALGFPAATAAVATLAFHICSQIVDYSLGGIGLLLFTLVGGRPVAASEQAPASAGRRKVVLAATFVVLFLCVLLAAWQYRKFSKLGSIKPPGSGRALRVAPDVLADSKRLLEGRIGFVVWSSNREGNHDLWMMDLVSGRTRRLTTNPHVDTFPRISPDGKRILFARSREPWVPQRNEIPWDAWMLDIGTGAELRLAEFAYSPTWIMDDSILFQRRGTQVVERVLSTGVERVRLSSGTGDIPGGTLLQTPSFNPANGSLVTTLRGAARTTALITREAEVKAIDRGCQHHWTPDGTWILGVKPGGRLKNHICQIDPSTLKASTLFDADGDYSHEYFPRMSADGRFLVYGASKGAHEHDAADYEIFLWKVGTEFKSALRLTYHTGNDCWPDIHLQPSGP